LQCSYQFVDIAHTLLNAIPFDSFDNLHRRTGIDEIRGSDRDGARTCEPPTITESRDRCRYALMHLDPTIRRFLNPQTYPVGLELGLAKFRGKLAQEERSGSGRN
jgi:hypothetical protein